MSLIHTGYLEYDELNSLQKLPSKERYARGTVAVIECVQEIPCNPCEAACQFGAIHIGDPITNLPTLIEDKCVGCGMCVAKCPGLAIVLVNKVYQKNSATITFPYEYSPLPLVGEKRNAVDRRGNVICECTILKILNPISYDHTPVITIEIPKEFSDTVRSIEKIQN